MKSFLKELTRRKVWLFGGIYLALASHGTSALGQEETNWVMLEVVRC